MRHDYIIETQGLKLRPITEIDLEMMRFWRNQDHIRHSFLNKNIITSEQQIVWYNNYIGRENDIMFIVEYYKDSIYKPVGMAGLYNVDYKKLQGEFGRLLIGETSANGRGLGKKITKLVCDFGFNKLELCDIFLQVFESNVRAVKIYEQCGFKVKNYIEKDSSIIFEMNISKDDYNGQNN